MIIATVIVSVMIVVTIIGFVVVGRRAGKSIKRYKAGKIIRTFLEDNGVHREEEIVETIDEFLNLCHGWPLTWMGIKMMLSKRLNKPIEEIDELAKGYFGPGLRGGIDFYGSTALRKYGPK
jgi:threonine/homoserine/homoserine lactone efflux protein